MKKKLFYLLWSIFLCTNLSLYPRESTIDSLKSCLKNKNVDKAKIYNDIATILLKENDSTLLSFTSKNLSSPLIDRDAYELFRTYRILGIYYCNDNDFERGMNYFLSAKKLVGNNAQIVDIEILISKYYLKSDEVMQSIEILKSVKKYVTKRNLNTNYRIHYYLGIAYLRASDFALSEEQFLIALKIADKLNSKTHKAEIATLLGEIKFSENKYAESLSYLTQGLALLSEDSIKEIYPRTMYNIGRLYTIKKDYLSANNYFNSGLIVSKKLNDKKSYAYIILEKAKVNLFANQREKALEQFREALDIFEKIKANYGILSANLGISHCLLLDKKAEEAFYHISKARKYEEKIYSTVLLSELYLELGTYYLSVQKEDSALYFCKHAISYLTLSKNNQQLSDCYELISNIEKKKGNYKLAFENYKKAKELKEIMNDEIFSNFYIDIQNKSEKRGNRNIIKILTHEKESQEKIIEQTKRKVEKQNFFLLLIITIFVFMMILFVMLSLFLKQRKADNKKLKENNKKIAQQKEEIEVQHQHLEMANKELEKLSLIAEETDNAVRIMDARGEIVWINKAYTRFYGYTLKEVKQIEKYSLLGNTNNADIKSIANVWFGNKEATTYESLHRKKNGETIWVQTTLTPILDDNRELLKMIAIDSNISRVKEAEEKIRNTNRDITESIIYAKNIQDTIMRSFDDFKTYFPESFCFYKPKSIVSGDFYWFSEKNNKIILACTDSTGHGVPGAFMSLMGISFLNKIVNEKGFSNTDIILDRMRINVIEHLNQKELNNKIIEGMDMSIVAIDKENKTLEYSGALNPIYVVRSGEILELLPDKMSISLSIDKEKPFGATTIEILEGDILYMFTDGFHDQFGGEKNEKIKYHRFKNILVENAKIQGSQAQKEHLEARFTKWKGKNMQIDDVLVIGVKIG